MPLKLKEISYEEAEKQLKNQSIRLGGQWTPPACKPRHKVAIIVAYRNRAADLNVFLLHMHTFLSKQLIEYGIYIIEPEQKLVFNRGLLLNIGFVESLKMTNNKWDCFVFHDADLLPEKLENIYSCPSTPRHLASAVDINEYKLPYEAFFGGVSSMTRKHMEDVNGFSNFYFGSGGEG